MSGPNVFHSGSLPRRIGCHLPLVLTWLIELQPLWLWVSKLWSPLVGMCWPPFINYQDIYILPFLLLPICQPKELTARSLPDTSHHLARCHHNEVINVIHWTCHWSAISTSLCWLFNTRWAWPMAPNAFGHLLLFCQDGISSTAPLKPLRYTNTQKYIKNITWTWHRTTLWLRLQSTDLSIFLRIITLTFLIYHTWSNYRPGLEV